MIQTGGLCKNCGHEAKHHFMSFPEYSWVSEWCEVKNCTCEDYIDSKCENSIELEQLLFEEKNKKEQEEIFNIITKESFPNEYLYLSEDFITVGKNLQMAKGRACVDGVMYEFYYNYRNGINKYSIKRVIK